MNLFGERLDILLKNKRLNQEDLIKIIDRSQSNISGYINNKRQPQLEVIIKLLEKFSDLNAHWLLLGKGEMIINNSNIINESSVKYNCENCEKLEMDKEGLYEIIKRLKQDLDDCKKYIPKEKRKAS